MFVEIDFKSGKAPYLQVVEQVKYAAATRALRAGDRLPSIRELAERLRVNRNTVAKAYLELEREGVVETRQGKGVFLSGEASPLTKSARRAILSEPIDAAVVRAHQFRIGRDEFLDLAAKRWDAFETRRRDNDEREEGAP